MPYNDEPAPSVDLRREPILYTHDKRPIYRQIGFAMTRGVQTTGTFPALSTPAPRKPKGKGKR